MEVFSMSPDLDCLASYPQRPSRLVIGLISGTSADGIDAAVVRFTTREQATPAIEVLDFRSLPYPPEIRERVMLAAADRLSLRETAVLGTQLGHLFAEAALAVRPAEGCHLIASHGQTVCHLPAQATTLQIGDPCVIAARTGVVTVADFRPADMACGGQGAPLVPLFDAALLAHPTRLRVAINLGGIANITVIPPGRNRLDQDLLAWDTGPANSLSDALCDRAGLGPCDLDGEVAAQGKVRSELLQEWLAHPYFAASPPKSTGLEDFGRDFLEAQWGRAAVPDLLRTFLALSAQSLVDDLRRVLSDHCGEAADLVFAGGGTRNRTLMQEIRERLGSEPLCQCLSFEDFGVPEEGREAAAFAFLGDRTLCGLPGNAPGATGARQASRLGKVCFPP